MSSGLNDWTTPQNSGLNDWITPDAAQGSGGWSNFGAGALEGVEGGLEFFGRIFNPGYDLGTQYFHQPTLSSIINSGIEKATGFNPEKVKAVTTGEKIARYAGQGVSAVLIPDEAPITLGSLIAKTMTGVAGGIGSGEAAEHVPERYKGIASLAGGLAGGGAVAATAALPAAAKNVLAPNAGAALRLRDFQAEGIPPLASPVLGNKTTQYAEAALSKMPGAATVYGKAQEASKTALDQRLQDVAQQFGEPKTVEGAGALIRKSATEASGRFRAKQNELYTDALGPVLDKPIPKRQLPSLENVAEDFGKEVAGAPESTPQAAAAQTRANAILRDLSNGNMTIKDLRGIRTNIGREIDDPILAGVSGAEQPYLRRIYGALSEDINNAAIKADPTGTVANKLAVADRYTRSNAARMEFLDSFIGSKTDAQIYNAAINSAKGGAQVLNSMRRNFTPDQWGQISGTVLGRMGRAKPGAQEASGVMEDATTFSPSAFLTNWSSLSPEAKQALFGGTKYAGLRDSLDRLVRVAGNLKDVEKLGSGSPTFERSAAIGLGSIMADRALVNLMHGNLTGAVSEPLTALFAGYVAPKIAAKYMTDPRFIERLANRASAKTPAARIAAERAINAYLAQNAAQTTETKQ